MRKNLIILFLFFGIVLSVFVYFYLNKVSSFQVFTKAEQIGNYPFVSWKNVTNGKLASFIKKAESENKLLPISPSAIPINSIADTNTELLDTGGIRYMQLSGDDFASNKYEGVESRPFVFVSFFKTKIKNDLYVVLVQKWLNPDNSIAFVPLVIPETKAKTGDQISDYYKEIVSNEGKYFISPVIQIKSIERCKATFPDSNMYCDWYFKNIKINARLTSIANDWIRAGTISEEIGAHPILFKATSLYKN